jgi:hypothetical protein
MANMNDFGSPDIAEWSAYRKAKCFHQCEGDWARSSLRPMTFLTMTVPFFFYQSWAGAPRP